MILIFRKNEDWNTANADEHIIRAYLRRLIRRVASCAQNVPTTRIFRRGQKCPLIIWSLKLGDKNNFRSDSGENSSAKRNPNAEIAFIGGGTVWYYVNSHILTTNVYIVNVNTLWCAFQTRNLCQEDSRPYYKLTFVWHVALIRCCRLRATPFYPQRMRIHEAPEDCVWDLRNITQRVTKCWKDLKRKTKNILLDADFGSWCTKTIKRVRFLTAHFCGW